MTFQLLPWVLASLLGIVAGVTLRAQALKGVSRDDLEAALRVLDAFTTDAAEREEAGGSERAQPSRPESPRREPTKRRPPIRPSRIANHRPRALPTRQSRR